MFYTNLERTKKLIKLGLDPNTADMRWDPYNTVYWESYPNPIAWKECSSKEYCLPCWSVDALIKLLPNFITDKKGTEYYKKYNNFDGIQYLGGYWEGGYHYTAFSEFTFDQELIDVLYKCVVWLLENNYIKKSEYKFNIDI